MVNARSMPSPHAAVSHALGGRAVLPDNGPAGRGVDATHSMLAAAPYLTVSSAPGLGRPVFSQLRTQVRTYVAVAVTPGLG